MSDTPPPCRDCDASPCSYITASRCERLKEWQERQQNTKSMVALTGFQLILTLIILLILSHLMYTGHQLISEKYDSDIVGVAEAAFMLGGMIGAVAMMAITFAKSIMYVAIDLFISGLKYLKDHITGENQKYTGLLER